MSAGGRSEKHASLFGAHALLYSSRCIPGMTCAGNYYQIWIVEGSLATQTDLHTRGKIPRVIMDISSGTAVMSATLSFLPHTLTYIANPDSDFVFVTTQI